MAKWGEGRGEGWRLSKNVGHHVWLTLPYRKKFGPKFI